MSKATFLVMVFFVAGLLSGCKKTDDTSGSDGNATTTNNTTGSKLVDKVIDASVQDVTVSVQGKVNVVIPKGMAPANTTITIEKIDAASLPKDTKFDMLDVYEVKLTSGNTFSQPLKITLNYDASKLLPGKLKNIVGAAYLDETKGVWRFFSDCVIDSINKTVTFPTNHLTKVGLHGFVNPLSVYKDYYSTTHFNIYWEASKIYTNSEYKSPFPTSDPNPDYIKDIGKYLEEAYTKYKSLGLTVPTLVKVDVYLAALDPGDDGVTSFWGYIKLNNKIEGDPKANVKLTVQELVPITCAHEFLHYVQDYYYAQLFVGGSTIWWLEATATQADRMVWPNHTNFESLLYANNVAGVMHKSWDDCNNNPDWYTAGCFLAYLSAYRPGEKANIAELLKKGGENTSISYFRTMIDTYLTTSLYSPGIGIEYLSYIKWAFEQKGPIQLANTFPVQKSTEYPYVIPLYVPLVTQTTDLKTTFPYLSVRSIKIYHDKIVDAKAEQDKEITITAKDIPTDVYAYIYKMSSPKSPNPITLYQGLKKDDKIILTLPKGGTDWIEILFVNTSKDNSRSIDIEVASKVPDDILTLLKKANGVDISVVGIHDRSNIPTSLGGGMAIFYKSAENPPYPTLNWGTTSFSSSVVAKHYSGYSVERSQNINGSLSSDGKILTSLVAKDVINSYGNDGKLFSIETTEISLSNLPIVNGSVVGGIAGYSVKGAACSGYLSKMVYTVVSINNAGASPVYTTTKAYSTTTWNADSGIGVTFRTN